MSDSPLPERSRRRTRAMDVSALSMAKTKVEVRLKIFVAGPEISKDWTKKEISKKSPPTRLRLKIKDLIEMRLMHEAVLGEHRGIFEMAEENLRSRANIAISEVQSLQDAHAVVMIPSSPGSFCELGAWSRDPKICRKMIILGDKSFESDTSYVRVGVMKLATDRGAQLAWVNYNNWDDVEPIITRFVNEIEDDAVAYTILPA